MCAEFGIGIIGVGFMGSNVFEALRLAPDIKMEVRAICRTNKQKLEEISRKEKVPFATTDYREAVERDDVDVVAIFSPDHLHGLHAIAALKEGKHVLCTKPMVTTMKECEDVVSLVRKKKVKFLTAETVRFTDLFIMARDLLEKGGLGEPIFAEALYVHDIRGVLGLTPWRLTAPQDFLLGGVCHPVELVRWLVGDVVELHAYSKKSGMIPNYPLDDTFSLNLKFENNAIGRVLGAYGVVEPPLALEEYGVYGTEGTLVNNILVQEKDGKIARKTLPPSRYLKMKQDIAEGKTVAPDEEISGHVDEVVRFLRHLQDCIENDRTPSPDAVEGAKTVAIGLAAWESIGTGKPVEVRTEF